MAIIYEKNLDLNQTLKGIKKNTDTGYLNVSTLLLKMQEKGLLDTLEFTLIMFMFAMDFKDGGSFLFALNPNCADDELLETLKTEQEGWIKEFETFMQKRKFFSLSAQVGKNLENIYQTRNKQTKTMLATLGYIGKNLLQD